MLQEHLQESSASKSLLVITNGDDAYPLDLSFPPDMISFQAPGTTGCPITEGEILVLRENPQFWPN